MMNIQKLNSISPVYHGILPDTEYNVNYEVENPDAIMVRSADMHDMPINDNLLCVGRAGAGVNNIPLEKMAEQGVVVFNSPGANANAVKELVIAGLLLASRKIAEGSQWCKGLSDGEQSCSLCRPLPRKRCAGQDGFHTLFFGHCRSFGDIPRASAHWAAEQSRHRDRLLHSHIHRNNRTVRERGHGIDRTAPRSQSARHRRGDRAVTLRDALRYHAVVRAENQQRAFTQFNLTRASQRRDFCQRVLEQTKTTERLRQTVPAPARRPGRLSICSRYRLYKFT